MARVIRSVSWSQEVDALVEALMKRMGLSRSALLSYLVLKAAREEKIAD